MRCKYISKAVYIIVELPSCPKAADPAKKDMYYMIKNRKYFLFYQISKKFMAGKFIAHHFVNRWPRIQNSKSQACKYVMEWKIA